MAGYVRQSAADIVPTAVVRAAPINNELNALRDAFAQATGHKHDGTAAEGHYIPVIGDADAKNKVAVDTVNNRVGVFTEVSTVSTEQVRFQDGAIVPVTDNDIDLGTGSLEFKDLYIDGTANIDSLIADTADINAGTIDNTVVGATTPAAATVTNLTVNSAAVIASADINAGTIDGAVIGGSSAQAITGTTVTATTGFVGGLTGAVTGNVTGNLTGNVTASSGNSTFNNITVNGTIDVTNTVITNVATPVLSVDAATKGYVDTVINNLIDSSPGTLDTLNEIAAALGDDPNFAATMTTELAKKLDKTGGTMTGAIAMSSNKITGLGTPTTGTDAVTKAYVDTTFGDTASAAASAAAAAASAVAAETAYDSFDDRYLGPKSSTPTLDNDGNALLTGALYFDTTANEMRVYTGSLWKATGSAVNGTAERYVYTATASQTTFAATYDVGFVDVYLNGVKQVVSVDFTASSGTSIVLATGATAGDIVDIVAYGAFSVADTYTQAAADAKFLDAASNLSDLASASTARTNLGLGTAAVMTGPVGDLVGTTDTQTLTNKTIDGSDNTITNINLTSSVTNTLPVANGGTGRNTIAANNVLLGNGTSAVQVVAPSTSGNVLTSNGTTWTSAALASTSNTQNFASSGTWTKPAGVTFVMVECWAGGGGGGSGRRGATNLAAGSGGGGGGGSYIQKLFRASDLGATVTVTIGSGGSGGAAVTATGTNGNAGGRGGSTSFSGDACIAYGGYGGAGAVTTSNGAGGDGGGYNAVARTADQGSFGADTNGISDRGGSAGGSGSTAGQNGVYGGAGGGGGGSINAGNALVAATAGGGISFDLTTSTGGGGAVDTAGASVTGFVNGTAGGGGSASVVGAASAGGAGGICSGGGGGGASRDLGGNSGAGGAGGNGYCRVYSW